MYTSQSSPSIIRRESCEMLTSAMPPSVTSSDCSINQLEVEAVLSHRGSIVYQNVKQEPTNFELVVSEIRGEDRCNNHGTDSMDYSRANSHPNIGNNQCEATVGTAGYNSSAASCTFEGTTSTYAEHCTRYNNPPSTPCGDSHRLLNTKPHECHKCSTRSTSLRRSKQQIVDRAASTADSGDSFKCDLCPMQLPSRSALRSHITYVHKERTHHCRQCSWSFKTAGDLRNHILTHTGERPFPCTLCPLKYGRRCDLNRHMRKMHPQPK